MAGVTTLGAVMWSPLLVAAVRYETGATLEACVAQAPDSPSSVWSVHRIQSGRRTLVRDGVVDTPDAAARAAEAAIQSWELDGEILGPASSGERLGKIASDGLS